MKKSNTEIIIADAAVIMYKEGRTIDEIAHILSISKDEVLKILMDRNAIKPKLSFETFRKEKKRREILEKIKTFWDENKEAVVGLAAITGGFATKIIHGAIKRSNLKKESDNKELYCYDRSLGHYWKLRRRLTNDEWVEIDKRKKNGERLADILDEMKVLY